MWLFRDFVVNSAKQTQEGDEIIVSPFKLSIKSASEPSEFEAVFIENGTRYQYGFSVDGKRVHEEWLFAVPQGGRTQHWFERTYNKKKDCYDWYINPTLKGNRKVWKDSTRDNALLLSTALQLKSMSLREPFSWIKDRFRVLTTPERMLPFFSAHQCYEGQWKDKILRFLESSDLGITDIIVREKKLSQEEVPDGLSEELKKKMLDSEFLDVLTKHKDENGDDVQFSLDEESDGTNVLFSLAGPWLDVLENGLVLIVDELHNSLHPHILRFLIGLFHDREFNRNKAQLIFTSHDTSLMSGDFMGRDQFWFVEKNKGQASELTPLLDFKPRKGEALERGYQGGRYGALPKIKELA